MDGKIETWAVVAAAACLLTLFIVAVLGILGTYGEPGHTLSGGISRHPSELDNLMALLRRIASG